MAETTLREQRVLRLAAQEKSNKEIGGELGISEETAKCHLKNALKKLNLSGKADLRRLSVVNSGGSRFRFGRLLAGAWCRSKRWI